MKYLRFEKFRAATRKMRTKAADRARGKKKQIFTALVAVALVFGYFTINDVVVDQGKSSVIQFVDADNFDTTLNTNDEVISATVTSEILMISDRLQVKISEGTVFQPKDGNPFDPTQLKIEEATFGIDNREIVFGKPVVAIFSASNIADGTEVEIGGGGQITTELITTCTDGATPSNKVTGVVTDGTITIYTCTI